MRSITPFATLKRFARPPETDLQEICDFCSAALHPRHRHLLEVACRRIICACDACALRFENSIGGRFKLIPRDTRPMPDFRISDGQWDNLALPINLVFIFQSSMANRAAAVYPGPAGATESLLDLETWQSILAENPGLEQLKPDVEALLINRVGAARDYFVVPIDACFELAGLIRKHWRGFSGGQAVWLEMETFFTRLRHQAALRKMPEELYA